MAIGIDPDLLARHVRGDCSFSEQRQVREWLAASPANAQELAFWRTLWESSAHLHTDAMPGVRNPAQAVAHIREQITAPRGLGAPSHLSYRPGRTGRLAHPGPQGVGDGVTWRAAAIAASVLVALGVGVTVGVVRQHTGSNAAVGREYITAAGQRLTVTLVDGTRLTLAPATRVRVGADYGDTRRDVSVDGEAYFRVTHDPRHPFAVHAGNALVEDLGTRFLVRSYAGEPVVRVVVADGRVSLGGTVGWGRHEQRPVLASGMLGEVDHTGVTRVTTGVAADDYLTWTHGELRFVKTPFRDVVAELGRWYDLDVYVDDAALGQQSVIASFPDKSADEAFTSLATAFQAQWHRVGRVVVFTAGTR